MKETEVAVRRRVRVGTSRGGARMMEKGEDKPHESLRRGVSSA